jgi:hypothetical protein
MKRKPIIRVDNDLFMAILRPFIYVAVFILTIKFLDKTDRLVWWVQLILIVFNLMLFIGMLYFFYHMTSQIDPVIY